MIPLTTHPSFLEMSRSTIELDRYWLEWLLKIPGIFPMRPRQFRDEDPVRRTATEVVSAALHPRNPNQRKRVRSVARWEQMIFVSEFQFSCVRTKTPIVAIELSYTRELKLYEPVTPPK